MKISTCHPRGNWFPSLLCGKIAVACLVLGAAPSAFAQHISVGIKAGVPLTQVVQTEGGIGNLPFQAQTKRYTFGPMLDIGLPLGLGIEVGAMYKRFDQQAGEATLIGYVDTGDESDAILESHSISAVGRSWEFPVSGQYHLSLPSMRPYVEGGLSFNRLSKVFGPANSSICNIPRAQLNSTSPVPPVQCVTVATFPPAARLDSLNRVGFLLGAGAEFKRVT